MLFCDDTELRERDSLHILPWQWWTNDNLCHCNVGLLSQVRGRVSNWLWGDNEWFDCRVARLDLRVHAAVGAVCATVWISEREEMGGCG